MFSDVYIDGAMILRKFVQELGSDIEVHHRIRDGYGRYILQFSNEHIVQQLKNLRITYNKLETRTSLPPISHDLMRHFIRGLFDGDGSICTFKEAGKDRYCLQFLGNPKLLKQVSLEIENSINTDKRIFYPKPVRDIKNLGSIISRSKKNISLVRNYLYNDANYYFNYKREKFYKITESL